MLAADGSAYVNNIGFAYGGAVDPSQAGPVGFVVLVRPDGSVQRVADGLEFPNGMAVVDDGRTLLVAESWGSRLTAYAIGADGQLPDRRSGPRRPGCTRTGSTPTVLTSRVPAPFPWPTSAPAAASGSPRAGRCWTG